MQPTFLHRKPTTELHLFSSSKIQGDDAQISYSARMPLTDQCWQKDKPPIKLFPSGEATEVTNVAPSALWSGRAGSNPIGIWAPTYTQELYGPQRYRLGSKRGLCIEVTHIVQSDAISARNGYWHWAFWHQPTFSESVRLWNEGLVGQMSNLYCVFQSIWGDCK